MKDEEIIALAEKHGIPSFATKQAISFACAIADLQKEKDGDILSEAMQSDLEHGVKLLNEKAAKEFHESYPALSAAIGEINSPETNLEEALRRQ